MVWSPLGAEHPTDIGRQVTTPTHRFALWRSVRALPEFRRLLELRAVSSFGDGLFQGGLVGALLFNPERAANPWAIAGLVRGAVPALLAARPVRRRAARPVGSPRACSIGANLARLLLMLGVALLLGVRRGRRRGSCAAR